MTKKYLIGLLSIVSLLTVSLAASADFMGDVAGYACTRSKDQRIKVNVEIQLMANHSVEWVQPYIHFYGARMKKSGGGYRANVSDNQRTPIYVKIPAGQRKVTKTIVLNEPLRDKSVGCVHSANINSVEHKDSVNLSARNSTTHQSPVQPIKKLIDIDNRKARTIDTCTIKLKQVNNRRMKLLGSSCTSKKAKS